jgi:hypothetical protein
MRRTESWWPDRLINHRSNFCVKANLEKIMKKYALHPRISMFLVAAVAAATLVACGGGGSSSPAAAAVNQLYSETNFSSNTIVRMARSTTDGTLARTG